MEIHPNCFFIKISWVKSGETKIPLQHENSTDQNKSIQTNEFKMLTIQQVTPQWSKPPWQQPLNKTSVQVNSNS